MSHSTKRQQQAMDEKNDMQGNTAKKRRRCPQEEKFIIDLTHSDSDDDVPQIPVPPPASNRQQPRRASFPHSPNPASRHGFDSTNHPHTQRYHRQPQQRRASYPQGFLETSPHDLSTAHKSNHFALARRPERLLQQELDHLFSQQRQITNKQSAEYQLCQDEIDRVRQQRETARINASQDVFFQNNSVPRMGAENSDNNGVVTIDFHGLYIPEAIHQFHDIVLPVLPVQTCMRLIVGKGKHTQDKKAKKRGPLKVALLEYIRHQLGNPHVHVRVDSKNGGVLVVRWKKVIDDRTS